MLTKYRHFLVIATLALLCLLHLLAGAQASGGDAEPSFALHAVVQDGLYGYADDEGQLVLPHQWKYAGEFRGSGYATVKSCDGDYGIITTDGEYVISGANTIYDCERGSYYGGKHDGVFWLEVDGRVGFMDVVTGYFSGYCYDWMQDMWTHPEPDLLRVSKDGERFFYVHSADGSPAFPHAFYGATYCSDNGYIVDRTEDGMIVLSPEGSIVPIPEEFEVYQGAAVGELIPVRCWETQLLGFCDDTGKCVIQPQYTDTEGFHRGYAAVCSNGQWGIINRNGQLLPLPHTAQPARFNGTSFLLELEQSIVLVEPDGNVLRELPADARVHHWADEVYFLHYQGRDSLMDSGGNLLITLPEGMQFDIWGSSGSTVAISEGFCSVIDEQRKKGYISLDGELVIPCIWDEAELFDNGWARVCRDGTVCCIDRSMQVVYPREQAEP